MDSVKFLRQRYKKNIRVELKPALTPACCYYCYYLFKIMTISLDLFFCFFMETWEHVQRIERFRVLPG